MRMQEVRGFTLIELLIVVAIIGIIAAIAVPGLLRARVSANEASAIGSLRAINSAQNSFRTTCGSGFYASSLSELGIAPSGSTSFLSPDLGWSSSPTKSGYTFEMAGTAAGGGFTACVAATLATGYHVTATPISGTLGRRYFATNTNQAIYEDIKAITISDLTVPSGVNPIQ